MVKRYDILVLLKNNLFKAKIRIKLYDDARTRDL